MDRLSDLTNFKRITAPFDGIVTSRGTDVGQLVNVGTAGATHALIDIPVGPTAKVRSHEQAERLAGVFADVAGAIGLEVDVVQTAAAGPIGFGVGPRLEALDVLAVLRREPAAPADLREKSLYLAARLLEGVVLDDDPRPVRAAACVATGERSLQLTLTEGKYHQVKRMLAAVGNRVAALHRSRIGALPLPPELAPGQWRWLSAAELSAVSSR